MKMLSQPFEYLAGSKALLIGFSGMLLASLAVIVKPIHFDGVLDLHFTQKSSVWIAIMEQMINAASLATAMGIVGMAFSKVRPRLIDMVGTSSFVTLAKLPAVVMFLLFTPSFLETAPDDPSHLIEQLSHLQIIDWAGLFGIALTSLCTLVLTLYWGAHAFSICFAIKGGKLWLGFSVVILGAEVISKLLVSQLNKLI